MQWNNFLVFNPRCVDALTVKVFVYSSSPYSFNGLSEKDRLIDVWRACSSRKM